MDQVDHVDEPSTPKSSTRKAYDAAAAAYHSNLNGADPDPETLRNLQVAAELDRRLAAANKCDEDKWYTRT